jgi:hypothetical protein
VLVLLVQDPHDVRYWGAGPPRSKRLAMASPIPSVPAILNNSLKQTSPRARANHIIKTTFDQLHGLDILIKSVGGSSALGGGVLALTLGAGQHRKLESSWPDKGSIPRRPARRTTIHLRDCERNAITDWDS